MTARKIPGLGYVYMAQQEEALAIPTEIQLPRSEVLDTLADYACGEYLYDRRPPAPSSLTRTQIKKILLDPQHRGGSIAGDDAWSAGDEAQDRAYTWAHKVVDRFWST